MQPIEIEKLEQACLILAQAIEDGRVDGVVLDIKNLLGYK